MKLRFLVKTIYLTNDNQTVTIEDCGQFQAAERLHDFLIDNRYVKDCGEIVAIEITANYFKFETCLPDGAVFTFAKE